MPRCGYRLLQIIGWARYIAVTARTAALRRTRSELVGGSRSSTSVDGEGVEAARHGFGEVLEAQDVYARALLAKYPRVTGDTHVQVWEVEVDRLVVGERSLAEHAHSAWTEVECLRQDR